MHYERRTCRRTCSRENFTPSLCLDISYRYVISALLSFFFLVIRPPPRSTLFPSPPLSRSDQRLQLGQPGRRSAAPPPAQSLAVLSIRQTSRHFSDQSIPTRTIATSCPTAPSTSEPREIGRAHV